jgi:hypothetical protein
MKRPYIAALAAAFVGSIGLAGSTAAQEPNEAMAEMMAAYQAAATPGPAHEKLAAMAGSYTLTAKWWQDPDAPPQVSTSAVMRKMIMDGRYLVEEVEGEMYEQPFTGMGITGYDNTTEQYVTTWLDNMSTGLFVMTGNLDDEGKLVWWGEYQDPVTKEAMKMKGVTTAVSDTEERYEMYIVNPDGSEWKTAEMTYQREGM